MLHLGDEDGTDWFSSPFQTKGTGEVESQKSDRVAKGKRVMAGGAIPEKGARRRQEQLLVSRW